MSLIGQHSSGSSDRSPSRPNAMTKQASADSYDHETLAKTMRMPDQRSIAMPSTVGKANGLTNGSTSHNESYSNTRTVQRELESS